MTKTTEIIDVPAVVADKLRVELSVVCGSESGLFTVTETGLELAEDISIEQYTEILRVLKMAKAKATLWLSDAIKFGERKFTQAVVSDILEQLEFDMPMVRSAITISSIPEELRFANLTTEHYIELAKAPDKRQQIKWARIASEQGLTASQLKFSIVENEVVDKAAVKQLNSGVVTIHGIRQSFDVWVRKVGGLEGVLAMDADHQADISEELSAIVEFGLSLDAHVDPASHA